MLVLGAAESGARYICVSVGRRSCAVAVTSKKRIPGLEQFTQTFRTHARSSWVLYYVILIALLRFVATKVPKRAAIGVLAFAILVSVVDSNSAYSQVRHRFTSQPVWVNQLDDPLWDEVVEGKDSLITYPPLNNDVEGRWIQIEDFVQRRGMATNAGYFSRWNIDTYVRVNQRLHDELRAGDLELDPQTRIVHLAGKSIPLSQRELALLEHLMRRPGAIVSKANLEGSIYGWGEEVESNTIEVHISNLRKKLGTERIITVRGVGYQVAAK